jgi:hypothetical protein
LGKSSKLSCHHQHLGGRLKFTLNTSNGAVFFCGVSRPRLNISISALLFFVPNKSENHAHISGGSLLYQVGRVRILQRSILRDAAQASLFQRLYFVVAQAAGIASFSATAQQKFKHRTGYTQPLLIQHRLQPAG